MTLDRLWAVVCVALPAIASLVAPLSAIDLAYHIRAGDLMLSSGAVLSRDVFTFTIPGAYWLNQQWGTQILLAAGFRAGWLGLVVLRAALVASTFSLVFMACRSAPLPARRAAILTIGSFLAALPSLNLRPQLFAVALFALAWWLLADRRQHPLRTWWLVAVAAVWANLHGSFFLVLALASLALLEDLRTRSPGARRMFVVGVASAVATLASPFGTGVWRYVFALVSNPEVTKSVTEWQSPTIRSPTGAVFFGSLFAISGYLIVRRQSLPWPSLLGLSAFAVFALAAGRGSVWWAISAPILIAPVASVTEKAKSERPQPMAFAVVAALTIIGVLFLLPWRDVPRLSPSSRSVRSAPSGIVTAIEDHADRGERIFVAQPWGSWFELALTENPVFVDSRIELYPSSLWRAYFTVTNGREGWQAVLDRWRVDVVVVDPTRQQFLVPRIKRDPGWRLVYEDEDGLVFVRA